MSRIKETNLFLYRTRFGIFNVFIMQDVLEKLQSCLYRLISQSALRTDIILDGIRHLMINLTFFPSCKQIMLDGEYPNARRSNASGPRSPAS